MIISEQKSCPSWKPLRLVFLFDCPPSGHQHLIAGLWLQKSGLLLYPGDQMVTASSERSCAGLLAKARGNGAYPRVTFPCHYGKKG